MSATGRPRGGSWRAPREAGSPRSAWSWCSTRWCPTGRVCSSASGRPCVDLSVAGPRPRDLPWFFSTSGCWRGLRLRAFPRSTTVYFISVCKSPVCPARTLSWRHLQAVRRKAQGSCCRLVVRPPRSHHPPGSPAKIIRSPLLLTKISQLARPSSGKVHVQVSLSFECPAGPASPTGGLHAPPAVEPGLVRGASLMSPSCSPSVPGTWIAEDEADETVLPSRHRAAVPADSLAVVSSRSDGDGLGDHPYPEAAGRSTTDGRRPRSASSSPSRSTVTAPKAKRHR